jgi:VWFA-related protein
MLRCARFFLLLTVFAVANAAGFAQDAPTLQPVPPVATRSVHPRLPEAPIQTLNARSQLVVVDVVVTDSKQTPIHNLKASDFSVLDNQVPQLVSGFEEHTAPAQTANVPPVRPLPAGIFTNFTPIPAGASASVLLLDALNTPMKDQAFVRDQLREFLKNSPSGTRIAIFSLNDRLTMLQGFTSDLSALRAVIDKSSPGSSLKLSDNVGNGGTKAVSQMMTDVMGNATDTTQLLSGVKQAEAVQASVDIQHRAQQTLDALNQLAHFLGGIPGRKNLIWFSAAFPLDIFPDSTIPNPAAVVASMEDEFRETTNLLARSQVAIYPVDARGLQTLATAIALDAGSSSSEDYTGEQMAMNRIAADTGGKAYLDANGLSAAVGAVIANGSNYYTLSYTPTNSQPDGKFHKVQVKLAQSGLTLAYRSGYFADEPPAKPISSKINVELPPVARAEGSQSAPNAAGPNALTRVMMRGAPDATEILLKLQVLPTSNKTENAVVPGNIFNPNPVPKVKIKGPFRRYAVDIAADANDIRITPTPDGHYQFSTEVLACIYDTNGVLINTAIEKAHGNLSISSYANMKHTGLPFHLEVSVPVNGDYYLRTSVHDLETDRYGSVELPVASVAKLPPLTAAVTSPR